MVNKILMPTFIPNDFSCPNEASGLEAESLLFLSVTSLSRVKSTRLVWEEDPRDAPSLSTD